MHPHRHLRGQAKQQPPRLPTGGATFQIAKEPRKVSFQQKVELKLNSPQLNHHCHRMRGTKIVPYKQSSKSTTLIVASVASLQPDTTPPPSLTAASASNAA